MPAVAEENLAGSVETELQRIRATQGGDAAALDPLKSLLTLVSPTGGTGIMPTALQTPAVRAATHLAVQKLIVTIERGADSEVDGLWQDAIAAARSWCDATAALKRPRTADRRHADTKMD
jgi:hypothetical protein